MRKVTILTKTDLIVCHEVVKSKWHFGYVKQCPNVWFQYSKSHCTLPCTKQCYARLVPLQYTKKCNLTFRPLTNTGVCVGQYRDLGIKRGIKLSRKNFPNGDTRITPIALTNKVIKVVLVTFVEMFRSIQSICQGHAIARSLLVNHSSVLHTMSIKRSLVPFMQPTW